MRTTEEWLVRAYLLRVADAATASDFGERGTGVRVPVGRWLPWVADAAVASDFGERGTGVRVPVGRCLPRAADAAGVVDRREGCRHEGH